jgi:hypothetical protein
MDILNPTLYEIAANVIMAVLAVAVPAVIALGANYLRTTWKIDVSAKQQKQLGSFALDAVMIMSQTHKRTLNPIDSRGIPAPLKDVEVRDLANRAKKNAAISHIQSAAKAVGRKVTSDAAGRLVEGAVSHLKRARGAR